MNAPSGRLASPACSASGSPRKTSRTAIGSAREDERQDSRHPHREPIAVALCAFVEKSKGIPHEAERRDQVRAWRQDGERHENLIVVKPTAGFTFNNVSFDSPAMTASTFSVFCILDARFVP